MIVNSSLAGIHIIFHEAHGLLAGKIAHQLKRKYRPPYWIETLTAICEHDDRQLNFDEKNYLSEIGVPLDFTEEKVLVQDIMARMKRVLKSAEKKSLWIKLLISYHLEFIYAGYAPKSKRIKSFLTAQKNERDLILKRYKTSDKDARNYYEFLRFCDRLSLILCNDETPEADRVLEINTSIEERTYFIKKASNGNLNITPWPFRDAKFELAIEERVLKKTQFTSSTHFEKVLMNTEPTFKKWTLNQSDKSET